MHLSLCTPPSSSRSGASHGIDVDECGSGFGYAPSSVRSDASAHVIELLRADYFPRLRHDNDYSYQLAVRGSAAASPAEAAAAVRGQPIVVHRSGGSRSKSASPALAAIAESVSVPPAAVPYRPQPRRRGKGLLGRVVGGLATVAATAVALAAGASRRVPLPLAAR